MIDYISRYAKRGWQRFVAKEPPVVAGRILCRVIGQQDLQGVIDLLNQGFWRAPCGYWQGVIDELTAHPSPEGYPKYGYMLENDGVVVGVLLTIFTKRVRNGASYIQCNESSYYVQSAFRSYAPLMVLRAHRHKDVTYLDLTPSSHTYEMLHAQGYKRIAKGVFSTLPLLCRTLPGVTVRKVTGPFSDTRLSPDEIDLLVVHSGYTKCVSIICEQGDQACPFVFGLRNRHGIPFAFLIYSRDQAEFVKHAGAIGWFLLRHGVVRVLLDADEAIEGMPGKLLVRYVKYWKGKETPRLGDLAYTEIAMFGVI